MKAALVTAASVAPNGAWQRILSSWRGREGENGRRVPMLLIISPHWPTLEPKNPHTVRQATPLPRSGDLVDGGWQVCVT